jgi:heptose I phosphotransferase
VILLPEFLARRWSNQDVFEQILGLQGEVYREKDGRKTMRFSLDGQGYFAKLHHGTGWKKILQYLFQFRLPVLSAQNEWRAIPQLEKLGIKTTPLIGYGIRGRNPAWRQSFVITRELTGVTSLEDVCGNWPLQKPPASFKRQLITEVAHIARRLHTNCMYHRDFYICHFLLDTSMADSAGPSETPVLYLIDLHRVQIRRRPSRRRQIKDIAGLYFSSMDIGLTDKDLLRFWRIYRSKSARDIFTHDRRLLGRIQNRAESLYRKIHHKDPPAGMGLRPG